jgi:hypothetical protein
MSVSTGGKAGVHLGVKDAGSSLDNADSLVISLNLVDIARLARDDGDQVQPEVLGVEIRGERVWERLLLASWDFDIVAGCSDIADNSCAGVKSRCDWLQRGQRASDESYLDRFCLIVRETQHSLCRVPIDELDAKDLSIGEGCRN